MMFTGLTETTGKILARNLQGESGKLMIESAGTFSDLVQGESIAVNGVCLTLESGMNGGPLVFHVMRETFSRTNLGSEPVGAVVNLERAMPANGRFGGHIVSGHVDCCGKVLSLVQRDSDTELTVSVPDDIVPYLVEKGSVAVDGVSLTIEKVENNTFRIGLIPTTLSHTNLSFKRCGSLVNLETDVIGKYVAAFLGRAGYGKKSQVSMQTLAEAGFL
jgi:riboflavin synthase